MCHAIFCADPIRRRRSSRCSYSRAVMLVLPRAKLIATEAFWFSWMRTRLTMITAPRVGGALDSWHVSAGVCMCVCVLACLRTCMCSCVHVHASVYFTHIHVRMYLSVRVRVLVRVVGHCAHAGQGAGLAYVGIV